MVRLSYFYDKIVESIQPTSTQQTTQPDCDLLKIKFTSLKKGFLVNFYSVRCIRVENDLCNVFTSIPSECTSIIKLEIVYKDELMQYTDTPKKLSMLQFEKNLVLYHILQGGK